MGLAPCAAENLQSNRDTLNPILQGLSWWFAVMIGTLLTHRVSGAHLNPSVTLYVYLNHKFDWTHIPTEFTFLNLILYFIFQAFGAFMAAFALYLVYFNDLNNTNDQNEITSHVFVTWPQNGVSNWQACLVEVFGTMLLIVCICGIQEPSNGLTNKIMAKAAAIGACYQIIIASFASVAGYV